MTKKQYFMFLWALSSLYYVFFIIHRVISIWSIEGYFPRGEMVSMGTALVHIALGGLMLFFGIYFAQKIGARLLLLDRQYDFMNDIFKPAALVGILYSGIVFIAHARVGILGEGVAGLIVPGRLFSLYLFSFVQETGLFFIFYELSLQVFSAINTDALWLLFGVAGIALLLKTIIGGMSISRAMLISVFICAFLSHFLVIWSYGFLMIPVLESIRLLLLGLLFWKKGFETAIFSHLIMVFILFVIVPAAVLVVGA